MERTVEEFETLLTNSGFKLTSIIPTPSPISIVEAVKAKGEPFDANPVRSIIVLLQKGAPRMSTDVETAPPEEIPIHDDFVKYPIHKVVSVFEDPEKVVAAVKELREAGYPQEDIEAFCGMKSDDPVRFEGTTHGIWSNLKHAASHIGPGRTYLERYERHLSEGHCLIMVRVDKETRKNRAADILHRHTDERVTYFGLLMADEMK